MTAKFSFNESPKGTLNLTVEDGPKRTTWSLSGRSRTPTLLDVFKGVYEALGGLPEPIPVPAITHYHMDGALKSVREAPNHTPRQPSEWDDPGEPTNFEGEPFPADQLLAPPERTATEQDSLNALAAAAARIQKMSFWRDDPEGLNPRLVNDLDAGQRPPELTGYTPSVRVEGGKLSQ